MTPTSFSLLCPTPHSQSEHIQLAHGEGARLSRRLIRQELLTAFANPFLAPLADAATLPAVDGRLVMTTDSSVVSPLFFPGGDIGSLAVYSAINDLAVSGADPLYLSLALILEEGLPIEMLRRVVHSIKAAVQQAGVSIVTGDTKVVPRGAVDKLFISMTGIGRLRSDADLGVHRVQAGDKVLVSGTLGDHGLAVLSAREGLEWGNELRSDSAPLHDLVARLLESGADVHFLRDPTRGGVAAVLHELVEQSSFAVRLHEQALPISPAARGACELLGLDPLHIANEGKVIAVVGAHSVEAALHALRQHPLGLHASVIGEVVASPSTEVLLMNRFGQLRSIDEPSGAPLPRIC
jgi:hydrogenase expression/formation protein HypE